MKESTFEHRFKNGAVITGTLEQILQYAKVVGEPIENLPSKEVPIGYYWSNTKGLLEIATMDTTHIINSLNKLTVEYYQRLAASCKGDVTKYVAGFTSLVENNSVVGLFRELEQRAKTESVKTARK